MNFGEQETNLTETWTSALNAFVTYARNQRPLNETLRKKIKIKTKSTMKGKKNPEGPHKGPPHLHAWISTSKERNKSEKKEEKEKKRVRNETTSPHTLIYKNPFISSPDIPSKTFFHSYIPSYIYVICNRVKSKVYRV